MRATSGRLPAIFVVLLGVLNMGVEGATSVTSTSIRQLDFSALPSDANGHYRTRWSNGQLIYIDDDEAAPSVYLFDRSGGKAKTNGLIEVSGATRTRIDDIAGAPDGTVWAGGHTETGSGQRSFFLAHLEAEGSILHLIQLPFYRPCQLDVARDGTVWTIGYGITRDSSGGTHTDLTQNVLRHFSSSGKLLASGIPGRTVGLARARLGVLVVNEDRLGWYSPTYGPGEYLELSLDMKILHSYPVAESESAHTEMENFVLTPLGRAFVTIGHATGTGKPNVLYELQRNTKTWSPVSVSREIGFDLPRLEGNDGEDLVFAGPPEKSKLQLLHLEPAASQ